MLSCSLDYTLHANVPFSRSSPQWESATNDQIHNYQVCLNTMLHSFSLCESIRNCTVIGMGCDHQKEISTYHDKIINAMIVSTETHILCQSNTSTYKKKVIPGWDAEMDCAREESLLWHYIWAQCDKPVTGIVYDIMRKCRSAYHYKLRSLKKEKLAKIKISVSKTVLKSSSKQYWKTVKLLRKNNYNTTSEVDGNVGNVEIANHFQRKFGLLFNSVKSTNEQLDNLQECINKRVRDLCDSDMIDKAMHCHNICKDDVKKAVMKLKSDKIDEGGALFSNNFIHGTDLLYMYISVLFCTMISHGFAPERFLRSTMIPIPKGARANLSDSNMYRSIAISSLLSKILDNIIIEQQYSSLSTSCYQFGFKPNSSTVLCSTMLIETVQYYLEKGDKSVYVLLLDASKAFDKVSFDVLFNLLLARNVCPRIINVLYYMYTNQTCYVKWNNECSSSFSVSNGVKQGGVISPLLFSVYIDNLFNELKELGLGCYVGTTYAGAFGYADDIALISPSIYSLKKMIRICESYAAKYHITFNPSKSKLQC